MSQTAKNVALLGAILTVLFVTGVAVTAYADTGSQGGSGGFTLINPLGPSCNDLTCPMSRIADFLFTISIPLCGIMVLVGGFQMMTAAGEPEKVSQGKKTILWAVIGFVIVLLAGSVASLIQSIFGASS